MRTLARITAVIILLAHAPFAPARANKVVIPGGSENAIQTAIEEVGPGGTVILDSGVHVLTNTVAVEVENVTVTAREGAILRGRGGTPGARLVLFQVSSDGFEIRGIEIEPDPANQGDLAVLVAGAVEGLTLERCRASGIVQLADTGIASEVSVDRNRLTAVAPREAEAPAAHLVVIRAAGSGEVWITRNRMEGPRHDGTAGIEALPPEGAEHRIMKNRVYGFVDGIFAKGPGVAVLKKNRVGRCTNGMVLGDGVTAADWVIIRNRVIDVLAHGIFLGDGDRCELRRNRASKCGADGMNLGGVFLTVVFNTCRLNGGHGIYGATNSCDYDHNLAERNGTGIWIQGTGNRLHRNFGRKNLGDGIVASGGNVNAEGNRGRKNGGTQVSIQ